MPQVAAIRPALQRPTFRRVGDLGGIEFAPGAAAIYRCDEGTGTVLTDSSGNGLHGTFSAAPAAPTWTSSGIALDGGDSVDISALIPALQGRTGLTIHIVASVSVSVPHAGIMGPLSTSANQSIVHMLDSSDGASDSDSVRMAVSNGTTFNGVSVPGRLSATPALYTLRFIGGSVIEGRRNGGPWARNTTNIVSTLNAAVAFPALHLGRRGTSYLTGTDSYFIAVPTALSDSQITQNERYIRAQLVPRGITIPFSEGDGAVAVAVGDSITKGTGITGVDTQTTYPRVLNDMIGGDSRMINEGVGGMKTGEMLAALPGHLADHAPWLVLIMGGTNDIGSVSAEDIESNLSGMVAASLAAGANVVLLTTPPNAAFLPEGNITLATVNAWIATQAGANVAVADTWTALRDPATPEHLLAAYDSGDGTHPNVSGLRAIAETAFDALQGAGWV